MSRQAEADLLRTAAYYDRTASAYDEQVDGLAINCAIRDAFCARVSTLAGPSGRILDFGCGTGTDAAWYAARGHPVVAYDISVGMMDTLRVRCADAIAQGRIAPVVDSLVDFERELRHRPALDGIAANFAVLNHVRDLRPVLKPLASQSAAWRSVGSQSAQSALQGRDAAARLVQAASNVATERSGDASG